MPPASARLSPRPTTLAVSTPPKAAQSTQPIKEVQHRQPQEVPAEKKNRGSTKPPCKERRERQGRKHLGQGKLCGASAGSSGSGQAGTASELRVHLCESIWAVHPLGQRVTVVGPVRQPPSVQPQPTAGAGPAAPRPQAGGTDRAAPAPAGGTAREEGTAKKTAPSCPPPSLRRSSPPPRDPPSQWHKSQPRSQRPMEFVPCVGPRLRGGAAPTALEELLPITAEQRPERERVKKLAQEERQRVARQMKIGP
ncbi:atherin-like, partial [Phasianus colchicus]|uniref:atherin-like n=1 Tax=Phasianus colchicus TaxID=9054 RepID=UPI00129E4C83